MFCLFVALLGFILNVTLIDQGKVAHYVCSCIACCGAFAAFPLLLSWLTNNVGGHTKKATAIGFVIGIGQIGGIIMPLVRLLLNKQLFFFLFRCMMTTLSIHNVAILFVLEYYHLAWFVPLFYVSV
jgi:hypothetical protein